METQIRPLDLQNKNEVFQVYNSWSRAEREGRGLFQTERDLDLALQSKELWGLVQNPGRGDGFIWLKTSPQIAEIICLLIEKSKISQGLGGKLIEGLIEKAKEQSLSEIWLEVSSENPEALHFYRKWGFAQTGVRKRYYRNGADAINMSRSVAGFQLA